MKMLDRKLTFLGGLASVVLVSAGCSSSGGGGSSGGGVSGGSASSAIPFTSFSSIQPNTDYEMDGMTVGASYEYDLQDLRVTSLGRTELDENSKVIIGYGDAFLERFSQDSTIGSFSVDTSQGDEIFSEAPLIVMSANDIDAIFFDADFTGWDYQSLGIWRTGVNTGQGHAGATSAGLITAGNSIPTSGSALYQGASLGNYVSSDGTDYVAVSGISATADFSNRAISISSMNSSLVNANTGAELSSPGLDFSGTLSFDAGSNMAAGQLRTDSGFVGNANSRFYGPNAEELGGVFDFRGQGLETYSGAFGASR